MPLYANHFAGHMPTGDPRSVVFAAGGCVWPTVPAYRYWFISDDATGDLAFLNTNPVQVQFNTPQPGHNVGIWRLFIANPFVSAAVAAKVFTQGNSRYTWFFNINVVAIPEALLSFRVDRNVETCNRDLQLPNTWAFDIDRGITGDTFRLEQIEFDQEEPPA